MLHKISQLCDKIDSIKRDADRLRQLKYGVPKGTDGEIDNLIAQIQSDCYLVSQDRSQYVKLSKEEQVEFDF
jgi:hypothetical protein